MSQSVNSDAARVSFDLDSIRDLQDVVNTRLEQFAPQLTAEPKRLIESMRYSLLAPGKRARAMITLLTAESLGGELERAVVPACSVEMVHAASLIIDDLPVMDDANMRRGQLTNHRAFGEDTSILAAIGLLSESFRVVARCSSLDSHSQSAIIDVLGQCVGVEGLVGGQEMDLRADKSNTDRESIEETYRRKTGSLFAASARIGAQCALASEQTLTSAFEFGMHLGVAFQAYDDLADALASPLSEGKDTQVDSEKATLVALDGTFAAMRTADDHYAAAVACLHQQGLHTSRLSSFVATLQRKLRSRIELPASDTDLPHSIEQPDKPRTLA